MLGATRVRVLTQAPRLARSCAFQAKIKEMEAAATKLAPSLPAGLKEVAESGVCNALAVTDPSLLTSFHSPVMNIQRLREC